VTTHLPADRPRGRHFASATLAAIHALKLGIVWALAAGSGSGLPLEQGPQQGRRPGFGK